MEIYRAVASFRAPNKRGCENVLAFEKGDRFEVLEGDKKSKIWWGARALKDNSVGYVPANYVKYEERKVGKILPDNYQNQREIHLKTLEDMQKKHDISHPGHSFPNIPEPDYQSQTRDNGVVASGSSSNRQTSPPAGGPSGLIEPGRLPNPCAESHERQELHRELLYNNKMGIDLLGKKTELQKEMERRQMAQKKKEAEQMNAAKRTSFDVRLEKQANKLKELEEKQTATTTEQQNTPEFLKIHAKIHARNGSENDDPKNS